MFSVKIKNVLNFKSLQNYKIKITKKNVFKKKCNGRYIKLKKNRQILLYFFVF